MFNKVKGEPNIAIISTKTEGEVLCGFFSVAVSEQDCFFNGPSMFAVSFESHGRCATPRLFFLNGRSLCPSSRTAATVLSRLGGKWSLPARQRKLKPLQLEHVPLVRRSRGHDTKLKKTLGTSTTACVELGFGLGNLTSLVEQPKQKARFSCRVKSLGLRHCFH